MSKSAQPLLSGHTYRALSRSPLRRRQETAAATRNRERHPGGVGQSRRTFAAESRSTTIIGVAQTGHWKAACVTGRNRERRVGARLAVTAGRVQHLGTPWAGQEPKEADADEAARQSVQQEPSQKLVGGNGHLALLVAVGVVFPTEGDRLAVEGDEPVIRDGDPMSIPGQVLQQVIGAAERRFGVDDPLFLAHGSRKARNDFQSDSGVSSPAKRSFPARNNRFRPSRTLARNTIFSTGTGTRKLGPEWIQRVWSGEMPPPGTTQCT